MTKRLKSKHKVDRRLKANIWGRPKSPFNPRAYPPGQHGQNKKGKRQIMEYNFRQNKSLKPTMGISMKDNLEIFIEKLYLKRATQQKI